MSDDPFLAGIQAKTEARNKAMPDDLTARLESVPHRYVSPRGLEELCAEAAVALAAKEAEIAGLRKQIVRMGTGADKKNAQIIAAVAEIAALKARLAAADGVLETARPMVGNPQPNGAQWLALGRAAIAYATLRAAQEKPNVP